jgi:hypothetical protein
MCERSGIFKAEECDLLRDNDGEDGFSMYFSTHKASIHHLPIQRRKVVYHASLRCVEDTSGRLQD